MTIISNITALATSTAETTANLTASVVALPNQVVGNRFEYWSDDHIGIFYVKIPAATFVNQNTVIRIIDTATDEIVAQSEPAYTTTTNRFSFQVDLDSLPVGDYTATVDLYSYLYEATGGLAFGGSAIIRSTKHYVASGTLILGSIAGLNINGTQHVVATGGLTFGGSAGLTVNGNIEVDPGPGPDPEPEPEPPILPGPSDVPDELSCQTENKYWCKTYRVCVVDAYYQKGLIPAITICNNNAQVKKLLTNKESETIR